MKDKAMVDMLRKQRYQLVSMLARRYKPSQIAIIMAMKKQMVSYIIKKSKVK